MPTPSAAAGSAASRPAFCPSHHDADFLRLSAIQKVRERGARCLRSPQRPCWPDVALLFPQDARYAVRRPGEYILRDSSMNHGTRKLTAGGMPVTYLGAQSRDFPLAARFPPLHSCLSPAAFEYYSDRQMKPVKCTFHYSDAIAWLDVPPVHRCLCCLCGARTRCYGRWTGAGRDAWCCVCTMHV